MTSVIVFAVDTDSEPTTLMMAKKSSTERTPPVLFPELTPKYDLACRVLLDDQVLLINVRPTVASNMLQQTDTRLGRTSSPRGNANNS